MRTSAIEDISATSLSIKNAQTRKKFNFDQVFDQDTTQQQLWDHISSSLTSFIQGYNVSIMAYGQSGSGKSYTMGTNGESMGIISRAAELMFPQLKSNSENNSTSYIIRVSYLEIYNEQIRDLLIKPSHSQGHGPNHVHATPITIRENSKGEIVFTGLSQIRVDSVSDLLHLLNLGCRSRQTSSTVINAESSRSHAIFTVYLTKQDHQFDEVHNDWFVASETVSKLNFVDLAGSERLKTTGAVGDKAKEGISINSGLANLGKVISQLSDKSAPSSVTSINSSPSVAHISYRDSKLTRVLQDSLGKRAITYLISCITCEQFYYSETLNTLTYAQRARAIQS
ncbi:kinesin-domain-containing protein, partial [Nadsonia fulvescens var. elongata DSM 6958]